jgi:hypothetical protein
MVKMQQSMSEAIIIIMSRTFSDERETPLLIIIIAMSIHASGTKQGSNSLARVIPIRRSGRQGQNLKNQTKLDLLYALCAVC